MGSQDVPSWRAVTRKCTRDIENLQESEDGFDVVQALLDLSSASYKKSMWCQTSDSFWLPCDAYSLSYSIAKPNVPYLSQFNYYIKLCKSITGQLVFLISVHV